MADQAPSEKPVLASWVSDLFTRYTFKCPGCKRGHWFQTALHKGASGPIWNWNGSLSKPTVSPSLLVTYDGLDAGKNGAPESVCHSYITDGNIQFLGDCTHSLRGQTVPLPLVED